MLSILCERSHAWRQVPSVKRDRSVVREPQSPAFSKKKLRRGECDHTDEQESKQGLMRAVITAMANGMPRLVSFEFDPDEEVLWVGLG